MSKIQIRGHCQYCGRQQAVVGATMSKHGYKVAEGWFQGVCGGEYHKPLEIERARLDETVISIRAQCAALRELAADLASGLKHPKIVQGPWDPKARKYTELPFDQGDEYQKSSAVNAAVYRAQRRADSGERACIELRELADRVHGQPLIEVVAPEAPPAIVAGERRTLPSGRVGTVRYVAPGGKVRWNDERGFQGTTMTRSWRTYPLTPA